jgi:hypothetical protein
MAGQIQVGLASYDRGLFEQFGLLAFDPARVEHPGFQRQPAGGYGFLSA